MAVAKHSAKAHRLQAKLAKLQPKKSAAFEQLRQSVHEQLKRYAELQVTRKGGEQALNENTAAMEALISEPTF